MQVVLIARETHWSRAEILGLPAAEFKALANLLAPEPK
jgi:hypothetical protein